MISDTKKGGAFLFDIFDPPPTNPPPSPLLKKVGLEWGVLGGVRTKNSLGDVFIDQNQGGPYKWEDTTYPTPFWAFLGLFAYPTPRG